MSRDRTLAPYVWTLVALAAGRFVFGGLYRYLLFKAAYRVETDLRAVIYQHLTKLSFSYFDRTQSGQVISRANSDIRSIQLLLAFGPLVLMSGLTFVLAFAYMMTIHVWLTLVALCTMPGVYFSGLKLRQKVFPLSWVVQARMAEMATVVDENIQGIRVVQSFAQERQQITVLARTAQRLRWASLADREQPRLLVADHGVAPTHRRSAGAALRRQAGHRRARLRRHARGVQRVRHRAADSVPHVRFPTHPVAAGRRCGAAGLRAARRET